MIQGMNRPVKPHGRWALLMVLAVVFSRLAALWIFENADIVNDSGVAIKLGGEPAYLDYGAYKAHAATAWSELTRPLHFAGLLLTDVPKALVWLQSQPLKPGPVFPALLHWADYENNRMLLSVLYVLGGAVLGGSWAVWLRDQGAAVWLQLIAACFPALVYYSFLVSTDLLFALVLAAWLSSAWAVLQGHRSAWTWAVLTMLLALLTRPNALALLPLMCILAWQGRRLGAWLGWCLFWGMAGLYMLIYYLPYYWVHDGNAAATHYWGVLPSEYHRGLWADGPAWLSRPLSWLSLAISKLMHAVGLRPSYAGLDLGLVLARAWPGLLFLPGLVYGLWAGRWFDRWFVFFFMLPVFVGAAQERYVLAITPLLLLWGMKAWQCMGRWAWQKLSRLAG